MSGDILRAVASWFSRPAVEAVGWALVHFLWQGTAVALLVAATLVALRRAASNVRYLTACSGLVLMAACPLGTLAWTWDASTGPPAVTAPSINMAPPIDRFDAGAPVGAAPDPTSTVPPTQPTELPTAANRPAERTKLLAPGVRPFLPWIVAGWLAGLVALSARLCGGWVVLLRMRRRGARPVAAEWEARLRAIAARVRSRPVRLLESAAVEVPTLIGWLRPVILLPASSLVGLSPRQLEALLAHELAHVRRHDYLVNLGQTVVEVVLFYHPAVWWLSRTVRTEREFCCDEVAAAVCGDRLEYGRALASMEALRGPRPGLAVTTAGGPLLDRIRRLTGAPARQANRSAWWVLAAGVAAVLAAVLLTGPGGVRATDPPAAGGPDDWGPEAGGLRCRLLAVPPGTDDEAPDLGRPTGSFARPADVTLAAEIKNVGDKPVTLMGVRYGDSYPTAAGKLHTEFFGPHLFQFEFADRAGKPIQRPVRAYLESMIVLSGASAHEIAPGKSLVVVLRPANFSSPMEYRLPPGGYTARVRYRGPSEKVLGDLKKHWPDKPQARSWSGDVASNPVSFVVAADPAAPKAPTFAWGEAVNGLQAAAEFRARPGQAAATDPAGIVPLNTALDVVLHLKNVSDRPVSLVSETWRQEDAVTVKDAAGKELKAGGSWYSGWPVMVRWTLLPGETADLAATSLAVAADEEAIKKFDHPVGKTLVVKPGKYTVRYAVRVGGIQTRDDKGNLVVPGKQDWQGEVVTGDTVLTIRPRTPDDDARGRAGQFTGRVEFVGKDGKPVMAGAVMTRGAGKQNESPAALRAGPVEVPDCSDRPLTITVRAPGYEEALFYDVALKPGETKRLTLTPAAPTRFRLIAADKKPVAGAKVRFFNKTSDNAGGGPYPMDGLKGPVWATSAADGSVVIDMMQKTDPYYAKLGDAVYFFYIDPPAGLAGQFLGGIKAGVELGDVTVSPPLEVRGEIRGSPAELDRFAAEWDQPFEMTTANPAAAAPYAVSERLETKREGEKLTFRLTGLRAGKLRIVANFGPPPHSVSHTYGRREAKAGDVVVEVDLKGPISDLVITPAGRKQAAGDGK